MTSSDAPKQARQGKAGRGWAWRGKAGISRTTARMEAYYNENDPFAAQWLRNLIAAGLIADGWVDDRSIMEVKPDDLKGFTQCHFFAGVGGWSAAFRLANWPDEVAVWTGSCPCQPFSAAGKQRGYRDERHLWPVFCDLIRACRPAVVFGEQVASAAVVGTVSGHRPASAGDAPVWFDGVSADLAAEGYAIGAAVLGAHSVGAPHIRQRLFWVADGTSGRLAKCRDAAQSRSSGHVDRSGEIDGLPDSSDERHRSERDSAAGQRESFGRGPDGGLPDAEHTSGIAERLDDSRERAAAGPHDGAVPRDDRGDDERLGNADSQRFSGRPERDVIEEAGVESSLGANALRSDAWSDYRIVHCRDGKARRVGPATSVLAHGVQRGVVDVCSGEETHTYSRTGAIKGLGNAIVPQVAAAFIKAFRDASH